MLGPILEGQGTRLEPTTADHLPLVATWRADLDATRYLLVLQFPPSPTQLAEWLDKAARHPDEVLWSIVDRGDGAPVGLCGLEKISWRHRHAVGWTFIGDRTRWRRGLGSEAARLRTTFAFDHLGFEKVSTEIYADHTASLRMMQKLGYRQAGLLRRHRFVSGAWQNLWLGEVLREEWKG